MRGLSRALEVLLLFRQDSELGVREMARRLEIDPAVVHRVVTTLTSYGFLDRGPNSTSYRLGPVLAELSRTMRQSRGFTAVALEYMTRLRDTTGETVALHYLRDGLRYTMLELESQQELRIVLPQGQSLLVTTGATDLVFRAFADEGQLRLIDDQIAVARSSDARKPPHVDLALLDEVRAQGWAVSLGVRIRGVCAVAAPVRVGPALYALTVFGPRDRLIETGVESIAARLVATSRELSAALPLESSPSNGYGAGPI